MKDLTIQEQVELFKNLLKDEANNNPSFNKFYDENRQKVDSLLTTIVEASNKPKADVNFDELDEDERLEYEICKTLSDIGLTFRGNFELNSIMFINQYEGLSFDFQKLKNNKINIKCKFLELDLNNSYCKDIDNTTFVEINFNDSWASIDVEVSSTIETTIDNLADDLIQLITKVKNLAQSFDIHNQFDKHKKFESVN